MLKLANFNLGTINTMNFKKVINIIIMKNIVKTHLNKLIPHRYRRKLLVSRKRWMLLAIVFTFVASAIIHIGYTHAASLGPLSPQTAADYTGTGSVGTVAWASPSSAITSDSVYASASMASTAVSHYLTVTNFGFTIPAGSTINGITAEVQENSATSSKGTVVDNSVLAVKGGVVGGTSQATATTWPAANSFVTYGGASNLWGQTWTPSDINSNGFGIGISAKNVKAGSGATLAANIDYVRVTVSYTAPAATLGQTAYRVFNNQPATSQITFANTWGGPGANIGYAMVTTTDGGYAVAGASADYSAGGQDAYLAKYDSTGKLRWSTTWGGTAGDQATSLVQTSDGGYAVTGITTSYGAGGEDMMLLKFDGTGNLSWNKTWGGTGTDEGRSVKQTKDGGYVVTGFTNSYGAGGYDMYLTKFDSTGNVTWSRTWGGTVDDRGDSVIQTADGGYAVTGTTGSYGAGGYDMFLAKYDGNGTLSWNKTWGGTGTEYGKSVVQTADGGYAVTGYTNSYGAGSYDAFLVKYDSAGNLIWNNTWGGTGSDQGNQIVLTSDGGYAVTGVTTSYGDTVNGDMLLIKYDSSGNVTWSRTWGGTGQDYGNGLRQASDGGYAVTGYTDLGSGAGDMFLLKYDSSGALPGCANTMCTSPTGSVASPIATTSSPAVTGTSPTASVGSPTATSSFPNAATTVIVPLVTPSIDVSTPLGAQNTATTVPSDGLPFRLRIDVGATVNSLGANSSSLKLQYAPMTTSCDASFTNTPSSAYQDVTDTGNVHYYHNASSSNGLLPATNVNDPSDGANTLVRQTYQEQGTTSFSNPAAVPVGQDGLWDFALTTNQTTQNTHYCMRIVQFNGTALNSYVTATSGSGVAEIVIPPASFSQSAYRWFAGSNDTGVRTGFAPKTDFATGNLPYSVTTGDFNGDGKLDLAVANSNDSTVSILLGTGTGSFGAKTDFATGTLPYSVTTGDFNGDGKLDLAVGNYNGGSVSILLGTGTGSFGAKTDFGTGLAPYAVTTGDFNGDGKTDLAVANSSSSSVSILLGTGTGSFGAKTDFGLGSSPVKVTTGDFNGDGKTDLVAADYVDATVSVLLGDGTGTFGARTNYPVGTNPQSVTTGDFNGDGKLDLAVANNNDSTVSILLNISSSAIGAPIGGQNKITDITRSNQPFRLRVALAVSTSGVALNGQSFKLQYAGRTSTCSTATYSDVTASSAVQWYTNPNIANGANISSSPNDPVDGTNVIVPQSYQSANTFTNSQAVIYSGQDGLWDFSLQLAAGATEGTDPCFRIVKSDGTLLNSYPLFPEFQYGPTLPQLLRQGAWFDQNGIRQNFFLKGQ
jgi:hypothetical protein